MQSDAFGIDFSPSNPPIEFHVEDFEGAQAELESRGVEFRGETIDSGVCHQAFFQDPDGNLLGDPPPLRARGGLARLPAASALAPIILDDDERPTASRRTTGAALESPVRGLGGKSAASQGP